MQTPTPPSVGPWGLGHAVPVLQVPLHPPRCSTAKGGWGTVLLPHSIPLRGCAWAYSPSLKCSHPKLALLEFECAEMSPGTWRGDRAACADTLPTRGVLVPLGSTRNPLELERKGPSWANPSQPPAQPGLPIPPKPPPRAAPRGAWAGVVGCRRSLSRADHCVSADRLVSRHGQVSSWGPAKTNPFVTVRISDWALQQPQSHRGERCPSLADPWLLPSPATRHPCPSSAGQLRSHGTELWLREPSGHGRPDPAQQSTSTRGFGANEAPPFPGRPPSSPRGTRSSQGSVPVGPPGGCSSGPGMTLLARSWARWCMVWLVSATPAWLARIVLI